MSGWKYFWKTDLKQKKADWAEFQTLRQQYQVAKNATQNARVFIIHYCGFAEELKDGPACINYKMHLHDRVDVPEQKKRVCRFFFGSDTPGFCAGRGCEYAQKNAEYHNACNKQDALLNAVNSFWQNKFAHVK